MMAFEWLGQAVGIAGIALAIEYSTRWGQLMQWYSYLWMRFPVGSMSEDDFYRVRDSVVSRLPVMKLLGFCPLCMAFWGAVILTVLGVVQWPVIGIAFIIVTLIDL
jgi:hypothetical protein